MSKEQVHVVSLANDIERSINISRYTDADRLARDIAEDLLSNYEIRGKNTPPKDLSDTPRGGRIW